MGVGILKKEQEGIIIEIDNHIAKVKVSRHGDCENCGACPGNNAMVLEVNNEIGAQKGEHVVFELKEKNMLKAAFVVYVLPLIFIFAGVQTGMFISVHLNMHTSTLGAAGGVIAFLLSILLIVYYERMSRTNVNRLPKVVRICAAHENVA
jgi:sigma-E factor negative regulatory protein RseC